MKRVLPTIILALSLIISGCGTKTASTQVQSALGQTGEQTNQQPNEQPNEQTEQGAIAGQVSGDISPRIDFQWGDLQKDILSPGGLITDGKPDGRFVLSMSLADEVKIKYIIMRYTEFGKHIQWAWAYNKSVTMVGAPLAVFQNSALVLNGTDIGLTESGKFTLDLYAPELNNEDKMSTLAFAEGQKISIQINYINKAGEEKMDEAVTIVNF